MAATAVLGLLLGMLAWLLASPLIHTNAMGLALVCFSLFGLGVGAVVRAVSRH